MMLLDNSNIVGAINVHDFNLDNFFVIDSEQEEVVYVINKKYNDYIIDRRGVILSNNLSLLGIKQSDPRIKAFIMRFPIKGDLICETYKLGTEEEYWWELEHLGHNGRVYKGNTHSACRAEVINLRYYSSFIRDTMTNSAKFETWFKHASSKAFKNRVKAVDTLKKMYPRAANRYCILKNK